MLAEDSVVSRVVFWGYYGSPSVPELFWVIFHRDDGGVPSFVDVGPTFESLVPVRTEFPSQGGSRFRFVVDVEPFKLSSGLHWIEIFGTGITLASSRTGPARQSPPPPTGQFFNWHFGVLDPQNGLDGIAVGFVPILFAEEANMAVELCGPAELPAVPSLGRGGLALLVTLVAIAGSAVILGARAR